MIPPQDIIASKCAPVAHFPYDLDLRYGGGTRWWLITPFAYIDTDITLVIPAGFVTDFNSIPRGLWNLFPPTHYGEAGLVHDWLYHHPAGRTRSEIDDIHGDVLELLGAARWRRWMMREGLRLGSHLAWNKHRARDRT